MQRMAYPAISIKGLNARMKKDHVDVWADGVIAQMAVRLGYELLPASEPHNPAMSDFVQIPHWIWLLYWAWFQQERLRGKRHNSNPNEYRTKKDGTLTEAEEMIFALAQKGKDSPEVQSLIGIYLLEQL